MAGDGWPPLPLLPTMLTFTAGMATAILVQRSLARRQADSDAKQDIAAYPGKPVSAAEQQGPSSSSASAEAQEASLSRRPIDERDDSARTESYEPQAPPPAKPPNLGRPPRPVNTAATGMQQRIASAFSNHNVVERMDGLEVADAQREQQQQDETSSLGEDSDAEPVQSPRARRASMDTAPSLIPSNIGLVEQVFGGQVPSCCGAGRPDILPFPTYAACRILDTTPEDPGNGQIFEALRTIAAYYLRADTPSICEAIEAFGLNDMFFSIARLDKAFGHSVRALQGNSGGSQPRGLCNLRGHEASPTGDLIERAASRALDGNTNKRSQTKELEAVRGVVAALMHELECILHEYLSFNWDRVDDIYDVNSHLLLEEGLSLPSTPVPGMTPRMWDSESLASSFVSTSQSDLRHSMSVGELADLDQAPSGDTLEPSIGISGLLEDVLLRSAGQNSKPERNRQGARHQTRFNSDPGDLRRSLTLEVPAPSRRGSREVSGVLPARAESSASELFRGIDSPPPATSLPILQQALPRKMLTASSSAEDLARLELEARGITLGDYAPRTTASTPATPRESVFSGSLRRSEDGGEDPPAYSSIQHPVLRHPAQRPSLEKEGTPRRSPSAPLHVSFPDKVEAPSENGSRSHHQHQHRRAPEQNGGAAWKRGGSRPGNKRAVCNWKRAKLAVTRKITQDMLGPQRRFLTLRQMFMELNRSHSMPPSKTHRQPIILLLGGGMAAGKSTVREIIGFDNFWSKVAKDAVVVEADAIKNRDVLYKSLSRMDFFDRDDNLRQHLHEYSTKAAEALLVTAVNQQRDLVFDGTMTWAPFVEQTIAMVRDHKHNYRRGPGYHQDAQGNIVERYWEIDEDSKVDVGEKMPYRIELIGVTCDTGLAVARGIWRKIRTGRSVPVSSQLRSHRLFSENFECFASLCDATTLYHTGSALTTFNKGGVDLSPKVIAHKSSSTRGELLINPPAYRSFRRKAQLNDEATCRYDLYQGTPNPVLSSVPTTEGQTSTLRQVFLAADRRERVAYAAKPTLPRSTSIW